jgi:hypothetical protein
MADRPCKPLLQALKPLDSSGADKTSLSYPSQQLARTTLSGGSACTSTYFPCFRSNEALETAPATAIALSGGVLEVAFRPARALIRERSQRVVHQGSDDALSCRLCLIACNSRQFDELESGSDR